MDSCSNSFIVIVFFILIVSVQLMVRSDLASSGVAFTLDPDTGFCDAIVITGSYGLGA